MLTIVALTILGWIIFIGLITAPSLHRPPSNLDQFTSDNETRNRDPG